MACCKNCENKENLQSAAALQRNPEMGFMRMGQDMTRFRRRPLGMMSHPYQNPGTPKPTPRSHPKQSGLARIYGR